MRTIATIAVLATTLLCATAPAEAVGARKCRKACKPAVAECAQVTGQTKGKCRKSLIRLCRKAGLEVCTGQTTTPTTLPPGGGAVTTTTLPDVTGFLGFRAWKIERDLSTEPAVFDFQAWFNPNERVIPFSADPEHFYVLDGLGNRYDAVPVDDPAYCNGDTIVGAGEETTCWVRFVMPGAVGVVPDGATESLASFHFENHSWSRRSSFRFYESGGGNIGG
jgi:hypothetical protein